MSIEQIKLQTAQCKSKLAECNLLLAYRRLRPSYMYPVSIFLDGSKWVCLLNNGLERPKCAMAYGGSPSQACDNFDLLWNGSGEFLDKSEEEEF